VNSGTSALEIILRIVDVRDKPVLVPANTFFATAAAVTHAGGRPILMDTDERTFGTSPEEIERRLLPNVAAVVVVHVGGLITDRIAEIRALCDARGVALVEDAAHAHGSWLSGRHAGSFGLASAFSFYPTKVMTCGEGGMIVTDDAALASEARICRDQGKASFSRNQHVRLGYNWRLSEPHAIIGLRHLSRLASLVEQRRRVAALYDSGLTHIRQLAPVLTPAACSPNYYKYMVRIADDIDRQALKNTLKECHQISLSGEVYEIPLHKNAIFAGLDTGDLGHSERVCARHICLPLYASMSENEAERVIAGLSDLLNN
jgi:dTDP-4-amino-4,6-dideoxygalactose transaminase